ncbi:MULTISPECIES: helix-turn-helix domain-containing protein [Ralstonia solanacearum species complex]|uniref:Cupin domain-containing protein n=1 Tax=Ralstonia syzygii TaxID=28097 RepID=A0ABX7ZML5_9RALS|nr:MULTISPECIES: XRE family transcriptional regulator [Ralstonia solanacearum species complex]BEU75125.1 XRE family transcriptional regulator [Ralstonia pseudosolanacearum]AMP40456.1 transcriptional regulator [Ralstonia solanacearum]AXV79890.1 XRE family transcriptional regulator [Ralstonia solanacearum]AXV89313.1 XRE family transcriptional regulator [Ralstonia solanacearum]AXV93924.1 XRE family transcriptional regulator [Ralstonia solanacearum]
MVSSTTAARNDGPAQDPSAQLNHTEVGARIREARKALGLTLSALSERSGVALSTISKAERGDIALTYEKFAGLAHALGLEFEQLLGRRRDPASGPLRPSFTPSGGQVIYDTPNYEYGMLADELTGKRMVPMRAHIRARSLADFPDYIRHPGEEFVFVLGGTLELRFENGDVFRLSPGDSLYFDSAVGHVYLSASEEDAEVLACCVGTDLRRLGDII